jgi:hypothetical protein
MQGNGFPLYQRCEGVGHGHTIQLPSNLNIEVTLYNNWVMPYNSYLSKTYKAHINGEVYGGLQAVNYIHCYIDKDEGSVTPHVAQNPDEIGTYLAA